ncbi:MAG TPA: ribosomal protein S18-alanine N-acetyltransferase [Pseudomonadaceae bacterium]|nr:ribosomal protein S18-alanine N-acetyltransferase [Pseudomonadaceae bacterium]
MAAMVYRPLQTVDLSVLQQALPVLLGGPWSLSALQDLLQASMQNSHHHCRVLSPLPGPGESPAACGFAEFLTVLDECQLLNLAVLPAQQRQGLGRVLLAHVLQEATERECRYCVLELRVSNTAAQALYRSAGFVECGLRKAYYPPLGAGTEREDALLLRRELG